MSNESLASLLNLNKCREIVSKFNQETGNNFQAKTFTIVPAVEAKGYLAEYYHLAIECFEQESELDNENGETEKCYSAAMWLQFFIKHLPLVNKEHEKVTIFRKESDLYRSLLPKLQKYSTEPWCPKVYLCHNSLLVLEYLDILGLHSLASKDHLAEVEMLPILSSLAALHASSLLYQFYTNDAIEETFYESLKEITVHPEIPWFTTGLNAILEVAKRHPKYQADVSQNFINSQLLTHLQSVYFMVNPSSKYCNVFCHRDTWGGNIFINEKNLEKSAIFVDFQTCRYSPPAIDVIFTLFMNLTNDDRLQKQPRYLKYYYEKLVEHVKKHIDSDRSIDEIVFSEEEFLQSIEEFQLFGFVYRALAFSILKVPTELVTDYYKNEERTEKLLQYMEENEEFRKLMEDSVDDILEAVVNKPDNN